MNKLIKTFGIIALVAIIGFSVVGCGDDDNGGGDIGSKLVGLWKNDSAELYIRFSNLRKEGKDETWIKVKEGSTAEETASGGSDAEITGNLIEIGGSSDNSFKVAFEGENIIYCIYTVITRLSIIFIKFNNTIFYFFK